MVMVIIIIIIIKTAITTTINDHLLSSFVWKSWCAAWWTILIAVNWQWNANWRSVSPTPIAPRSCHIHRIPHTFFNACKFPSSLFRSFQLVNKTDKQRVEHLIHSCSSPPLHPLDNKRKLKNISFKSDQRSKENHSEKQHGKNEEFIALLFFFLFGLMKNCPKNVPYQHSLAQRIELRREKCFATAFHVTLGWGIERTLTQRLSF